MENIILQKTRYLKALMLTMLVGFFAFGVSAQTFTDPGSFNAGQPAYAGEEAEFTYDANNDWPAGTTFILWDDVNTNNRIDEDETVFGTSQEADAVETITFDWPENVTRLRFGGFSGDTFLADTDNFQVTNNELTVFGSNSTDYFYLFSRNSLRQATTVAYDFNVTAPVRVDVTLFTFVAVDAANPVEVLYSTDGFATAGTVLEDINSDTEFLNGGTYTFELPPGAKTANTSIRIRQAGNVNYGTGETWYLDDLDVTIGDEYTLINPPGLGYDLGQAINIPFISITDALDETDASETDFYPGDEVTLVADLQNVELTDLSFVASIVNNDTGEEYLLDGQTTPVKDNGTKEININGTIPTNIEYFTDLNGWDFKIQAYEGSEPLIGLIDGVDFTGNTPVPADFTSTSTKELSTGLTFDQAGERSILTREYSISSVNGLLSIDLARDNDRISPPNTDIIIEYTTDGTSFEELTSVEINSLPRVTSGNLDFLTVELDVWPAGVVSNSTQFRIRQESNSGEELDAWVVGDISILNETNIIPNSTVNWGFRAFTLPAPAITIDIIEIGADGLAYPMEDYSFTYTIDEGEFPANTSASLILDREDDGLDIETDIIIGSVDDVTSASIDFTVPPLPGGDYDVHLVSQNGVDYGSQTLSIYNNELQITSITFDNPVLVGGEEFGTPGSGITVEYSVLGDAGSAAEIMLSVEDDDFVNADERFVMITASNTINGTITGTLPTNFAYTDPANLQLSFGNSGVFSTSPFDQTVFTESFGGSNEADNSIITFEGNTTFNNDTEALTSGGVRAINIAPQSIPYGGTIDIEWDLDNWDNFTSQDVLLQGSIDGGTTWEDIDELTMSFPSTFYEFNQVEIPNNLWSENTSLRIITNQTGEWGFEENVIQAYYAELTSPEPLNGLEAEEEFNIVFPTLSVDDSFNPDPSYIGQEYTVTYNAIGFPAGTEFAAVIEQGNAYYVAGSSAEQGAGSITFNMPVVLPLDEDNPNDDYDLFIYPYLPATAGDMYTVGQTIEANMEEDFLINTGDSDTDEDYFEMSLAGDREILTRAFDLSNAESATISFDYYLDDDFEITANKNVVPRLEVSIDGGATFQTINVEDLAPGEMSMYDEGLLYEDDEYDFGIEIPSEFLTEATHFRWSQPLNLGDGKQVWEVENIEIELNGGNVLNENVYEAFDNEFSDIDINDPSLDDYTWMQTDLQDAVFNGESFGYSFDFRDGLDATTAELFPAGTEFTFSLDVEDPETGENVVIATASTLGVGEATVPIFVSNGAKQVNVTAVVEINGEEYTIFENANTGNSLEVFNQVLNTTFSGNANEVYYAGNEVTIDYAFENDVTSESIADLQYNLILLYDSDNDTFDERWLLAVDESLTGSFTVDMPPFVNGTVDFVVEASVGGPLGTIGETLENSGIDLDDAQSWLNEEVALEDENNLPGGTPAAELDDVSGRRVLTTTDLDLVAENSARLSFNLTVNDNGNQIDVNDVLEDQQMVFEYSTDGGATYTELETFLTEGDQDGLIPNMISRNYVLDGDILTASTRFRFRQEESRFTVLIDNMTISEAGAAQIDFVSANANGFVPGISPQSIQITSIDSDEACLSDEVTLNYDIRGKFGADNKVMVEYGDGADLRSDVINVAANELGFFRGQNSLTTGSYPVEFTQDNSFQRRVITDYFDISGGTAGEVTIDVSTLSSLNEDLEVYIDTFSSFRFAGSISSGGVETFTLNANELTSNTRIWIEQNNDPAEGEDVWTLNSIQIDIFGAVSLEGYEFDVTEGSGSVAVQLPSSLFDDGDSNKQLRFRLVADDDTFEGIDQDYEVTGSFNEVQVEVVAPIDINADFNLEAQQLCDVQDVMATIVSPNDYFTYQIVDALTGEAIGDPLTYDPELMENEINLGELTDEVRLSLQVTSASSSGETCNTITSTVEKVLDVQPNYALFMSNLGAPTMVQAETVVDLCSNTSLTLRASYYDNNGDRQDAAAAEIEWFRDDLQTPVGSSATLFTFNKSGDYFARITDGNCIYTTESITVNVAVRPDQPVITVEGDLNSCDPENTVTLSGPEGFANYVWEENTNQLASNSRVITVDNAGTYQLRVSNSDLSNSCGLSNFSDPVVVNIPSSEDYSIEIANAGYSGWSVVASNEELDVCESDERAIRIVNANGSWIGTGANVTWFKDGVVFEPAIGTTVPSVSYPYITESGVYFAEIRGEFGDCVFTTDEVTFNVLETPDAPTLTADGALSFCEGEGTVTLTAPEGFDYYSWRKGSAVINSTTNGFANSNVIEVSTSGSYTVSVSNSADVCQSALSNPIVLDVVDEPVLPNPNFGDFTQVNISCGGAAAEFEITNDNNDAMTYQLYNGETGEVSGNPITLEDGQTGSIFTDVLTENGIPFYVEVMYADGTGCSNMDPSATVNADIRTISLEVQGSTLTASYSQTGVADIRWYRNDVLLNSANGSSLTISDAAEYSIEVEYESGCVITASSADIAGKVLGNEDAMAMKVVSYPNPAQADVTLNVNSQYMGKHEVTITSMTGQVMMQSSFEKSGFEAEHAMDIANLEEGIYNVQIRHDGLTQNVRIIKK
ncbi:T9SS type A sorting domain-containing protein [Marivirga sp.]|uniref:T9SS type A sorting domain-containing protein n=1 Tax=Marivirga sp. TaxID=2018662 RepID=UPI003DA7A3F5